MIQSATSGERRNDRQLKLIGLVVVCAPLWWVLGINLLVYHFAALALFLFLVIEASYDNKRIQVPLVAWMLLAISAIYSFSIVFNSGSHTLMRIIAALNNVTYWIMGAMLIVMIAIRFRSRHIAGLLRVFPILGTFNVAIALLALAIASRGVESLSVPSPLYGITNVLGRTALVDYSVQIRLITTDYFSGRTVPRFNLYAPYPTAAGAFFMISLPMLVAWGVYAKRLKSPVFWLLLGGHLLGLGMTLARMAIAGLAMSAVLVYILSKRNLIGWVLVSVVTLIVALPVLIQAGSDVIVAREGSSLSRFALYRDSIDRLEGSDWIVGRGIRTYSETHRMPYGSHSTFVSLLYRTGVVGLSIFVLLQIVLLARWYGLKKISRADPQHFLIWRVLGVVFLSMSLWMLTEDIDVPQLLAFMYFAAIGVLEGLRKELLATAEADSQLGPNDSRHRGSFPSRGLPWRDDLPEFGVS